MIICALPRTGSSLLGALLGRSGAVGRPAEWFRGDEMERNRTAWGRPPRVTTSSERSSGYQRDGGFAAKVMWSYMNRILFELRRLAHEYDADDLAALPVFFPSRCCDSVQATIAVA